MKKRAQAAMEFLMTYGWAILIVVVILAALFFLGVFNPKTTNTCLISAPFICQDTKVFKDSAIIILKGINIASATIKNIKINNQNCELINNNFVIDKQNIFRCFGINLNDNDKVQIRFDIDYASKVSNIQHTIAGTGDGKVEKKIIGIIEDSTMGSSTWWQDKLKAQNIDIKTVKISEIDTLDKMNKYSSILNPYGETYPETSCISNPSAPGGYDCNILDNIRRYVYNGGYWFESGGFNFYYSLMVGDDIPDLHSNGDDHVCVDIGWETDNPRTKTSEGTRLLPGMQNTITGSARPSHGMTTTYQECQVNIKYIELYKGSFSGPSMHCYGSGCIIRTDDTNDITALVYGKLIS